MKKTSIISVLLGAMVILSLSANAQDIYGGRRFYAEFGGPGIVMSVNYDSRIKANERLGWGYRLGAGFGIGEDYDYYDYGSVSRTYYSVPVGVNYLFGKTSSSLTFEVGATVTVLTRKTNLYNYEVVKPGYVVGGLQFMFCRIPLDGGFTFRIGFTPMIGTAGDLFPMGAIGLGYAF